MDRSVRVNAGSDDEDVTSLDGFQLPSVNSTALRQSRLLWPKGASNNSTRTHASMRVSSVLARPILALAATSGQPAIAAIAALSKDGFCVRHSRMQIRRQLPSITLNNLARLL